MQHALSPEDEGDRGAGLRVSGLVRQIIRLGEALVGLLRAQAGGDVHLRRRDVAPQRFARALQAFVVELGGEIGHRAQHVHRPDRMADDLGLFAHRKVRLIVFVGSGPILGRVVAARDRFLSEIMRRLMPALVDEVAGKVEPALISGQPVELEERELDLLMAGVAALLAGSRSERRGDMVDVPLHDVEEAAAAGDAEVGDRAFQQMAGVVKLVIVAQVGPALVRLAAVVPAIEIAVRRLRLGEVIDDRVDLGFDVGIAPMRESVSSPPRSICRRPSPRTPGR